MKKCGLWGILLLLGGLILSCTASISTIEKKPDNTPKTTSPQSDRNHGDTKIPLTLHASIKNSTDAVVETYLSEDYPRCKYEFEALLKLMDPLLLESRADKINHLDTHYPPVDQAISYAIIDDDLRWRNIKAATAAEMPTPVVNNELDKAEVADNLFENPPNQAAIEMPRAKKGAYFKRGLHKFIQKEIREVALHMGEPADFKLPDDFVAEIEFYIRRFQNEPHYQKFFRETLRRSRKYIPAVRDIFRERNLPEEIIYLAFIESGFNPIAYSRSHAAGLFQFIKSTGRQYGLTINRSVDERYSPLKSAVACREYLNDLLLELGSFTLALSSYNSGAGKTRQALRQLDDFRYRSFWTLRERTKVLKHETREYVPQIFAAIVMARPGNPPRFGFKDVPFPENYEMVIVPSRVSLSAIAGAANISAPTLLKYNPDLSSTATHTPRKVIDYPLFVPRNARNAVQAAVDKLTKGYRARQVQNHRGSRSSGDMAYHRVKKGESLWLIARKYGVTVNQLKQWNGLRNNQIYSGKRLVVYGSSRAAGKASTRVNRASAKLPASGVATGGGIIVSQRIVKGETFRYMVSSGNSLSEIAALFGVGLSELRRWNHLQSNQIQVGRKLKLIASGNINYYQYRVQSGDTIGEIASRLGTSISAIQFVNGKDDYVLRIGEIIKVFSL